MLPKLVRFDRDVRLGTGLMAGEVLAPAVVGHIYRRASLAVAAADRDVIAAISDATAVIDLHDHDHATAGTLAGLEPLILPRPPPAARITIGSSSLPTR